jgi:hypothetical protein
MEQNLMVLLPETYEGVEAATSSPDGMRCLDGFTYDTAKCLPGADYPPRC